MGPILFFAENCVLGSFGNAELHDSLGLDLDGFTGGGIPTDTGFAIDQNQLAEPWNGEGVLGVFVSECSEMFKNLDGLLFGDAVLFGNFRGDLGFGQCFCHNSVS